MEKTRRDLLMKRDLVVRSVVEDNPENEGWHADDATMMSPSPRCSDSSDYDLLVWCYQGFLLFAASILSLS